MKTWNDVREYLRARYQLTIDEEVLAGIHWDLPHARGRQHQRQLVSCLVAFGELHLQIMANVVNANGMSPVEAVEYNATTLVGGLCLVDGTYVMRVVIPLAGLETKTLDRTLRLVAHQAADLRLRLVPKSAAPYYE